VSELVITSPGSRAGSYEVAGATFGTDDLLEAAASVVLANDATATPTDGCEPPTNSLTNKIAIVDRGSCPFVLKANNAAAAAPQPHHRQQRRRQRTRPPGWVRSAIAIPVIGICPTTATRSRPRSAARSTPRCRARSGCYWPRDGTIDNAIVATGTSGTA
jgi:hypothetical protein